MELFTVFVKTDDTGRVIGINSSAFLHDTTGWQQIDAGYSTRHYHAQVRYLPRPLTTEDGVCRYKLVDGRIVERTAEEMAADMPEDVPAPPPAGGTVIVQPDPALESRLETVEQSIEMLLEGVTEDG